MGRLFPAALGFNAAVSSDPDGDGLVYSWSFYDEPSSHNGAATIQGASTASATVAVPSNASGKTLHMLLQLRDRAPLTNLYACRRVIIKVP